ncbi:DUF6294 family protein [Amycolatopsis sp. NPDC059027]|uniref:DUF6294 family protein n=1 Tax=unclassified Amycolatopsis TaxID=2618356 RepID=UPI0036721857
MMTKSRRVLTVVAALVLAGSGVVAAPASATTQTPATVQAVCANNDWCSFSWGRITVGDCAMERAKWTLRRDGSASFEAAIVSSDTNDAWLMWVDTLDDSSIILAPVHHGGDTKFVEGTIKNQWHWWFASGNFNAGIFDRINSMRMRSHC